MATFETIANLDEVHLQGSLQTIARNHVGQLCELCRSFLRWEREEVLRKNPTLEERQEHQRTLRWLLRAARLLHSLVADPDFPERSARHSLEGVIRQLEESWQAIYQPMPEAEANRLIAEVFPDEPRA